MEDKKALHNYLAPDPDGDRNFWMMAQQGGTMPRMSSQYRGFYPMIPTATGPPGVSAIRHILPQIPTRASNPRTAVSKASMREPFPNLPRGDPVFSNILPSDPISRDIIWREDFKDGSGREALDQGPLVGSNKFDLMSSKTEYVQDMSMAAAKSAAQFRDSGNKYDMEDEFCRSDRELVRKTERAAEINRSVETDARRKRRNTGSTEKSIPVEADFPKSSYDSENDASDGESSLPICSTKSADVVAPANPIKLKIRCDFREGHKELMAIIGKDPVAKQDCTAESVATPTGASSAPSSHQTQQPSPLGVGHPSVAPPSPQAFSQSAPVPSPSMNIVRPKTGRAKTNAELKKQLMEKRAVQYLKGQGDGGSQASSPATSHIDVSSPASLQADAPSPLSAQAENLSADPLEPFYERASVTKQDLKGTKSECNANEIPVDELQRADTKWVVGDMLWARVSGHPWWPCIISPDPFQQMYTKVITRGQKISFRQYHVQFFGEEGERGWVQESSAIPFEGRTKFENYCQEMIKEHKKEKKNYTVTPNRRRAWEVAVSAAEHARTMPRVRRIEEYVNVYEETGSNSLPTKGGSKDKESARSSAKVALEDGTNKSKPQSHVKQTRKSSIDEPLALNRSSDGGGSPPRKKPKLTEPPAAESPSHIKLPKNVPNQCVVQYAVFCQKRRESVKNEHPDFSEEQVEDCLQEQWSKLDDETRSRFIPMGSEFTYLSQMMATAGVPKAPTGVKRSSRFVKPKKVSHSEKLEKTKTKEPKEKEPVVEDKESSAKEDVPVEEKRTTSKLRSAAVTEQSPVDIESPRSRRSQNASVNGKAAEAIASSPVVAPEDPTPAFVSGIPLKKRGRKSKEVARPPSVEKTVDEESCGDVTTKKVSTPAARKEVSSAPKPVVGSNDDDEDTEEELDDANVCFICEKATKGIEQCQGPCRGLFHPACLNQSTAVGEKFQCDECITDNHKCFICKKPGPTTLPCTVADCGRFYHEDCLKTVLPEGATSVDRPLSCPLHTCFTCQLKKLEKGSVNDDDSDLTDLFICVRCPTAYHMTDSCVSAGSQALTGRYIVCSRHFEPSKAHSLHTRTSSSWCFKCDKGGSLLYCDCCPAAYHAACLEISSTPSGAWKCPDCSRGRTPLYGDLVWVKFGSYRWWPAEIYHPASLPSNIQDLPHQVGEFPVCFFGSHDYLWLHRGRVFPFKEGDRCCREADARGTAKIFDKAMKEAIAVYRMLNPNSKPVTSVTDENTIGKPGKGKIDEDDDNNSNKKDDDEEEDGEAKDVSRSSLKTTSSGDRKMKRARVRSNSKALRQLQRQSRVLNLITVPRSIEDGDAPMIINDHENKCYRCGETGQLILCDKPKCQKAYHLKCIHKSKLPHGMWLCPWHHCDICGKASIQLCSRCPNSYCADHILNNILFSVDYGMTCLSHPDVTVDGDSEEKTFQLPWTGLSSTPAQQSQSKESGDTGKKRIRQKSVKKQATPSSMERRVGSLRKSAEVKKETKNESGSESDLGQLTIADDRGRAEKKDSKTKREPRKRKPVSRSSRSDDAPKKSKSSVASRSSEPALATAGAENSQPDNSSSKAHAGKSKTRADSPMFDNSDDEFPQLVIDVPTL